MPRQSVRWIRPARQSRNRKGSQRVLHRHRGSLVDDRSFASQNHPYRYGRLLRLRGAAGQPRTSRQTGGRWRLSGTRCGRCGQLRSQEDVSKVLIPHQMARPNSQRLMKSPITKSCMRSVLEKQIVRRTNRLIRVRKLVCLLSIFCVFALPTVCCSGST